MPDLALDSPERRRSQVYRLLREGAGEKMLIGRSRNAARVLRQAYNLARSPTRILSPLYEVSVYRLANVLFRSAETLDELREVDGLYAETTGDVGRWLGPMPFIHRIAVLHRIGLLLDANDRECAQLATEMARLFGVACELARSQRFGELPGDVGGAHVQGSLHNLLELTAYFTDQDYEARVAGLVSPFEDLKLGDEWMLVGTGGVDSAVRMPKALAEVELSARERQGADLLFELGRPRARARFRAWRPDKREFWTGSRQLLMLAQLCREPSDDSRLYQAVYGDEAVDETKLRDAKRELRDFLEDSLGQSGTKLLPVVETGRQLRLDPNLRIYGMVSVDSLRVDR